jgi:hypothetical protein
MAMPPPSSMGKEHEIAAIESPSGGAHGSPAWSKLEEDKGAASVSANMGTGPGVEEAQAQADECLAQASGPPVWHIVLEGNQEWAMVLTSRLSGPTSGWLESGCGPTPANRVRPGSSCTMSGR